MKRHARAATLPITKSISRTWTAKVFSKRPKTVHVMRRKSKLKFAEQRRTLKIRRPIDFFWFCGVFLAASVFLGGHVKCFITKKLVWTKTPENRSIFQLTEECWWASPTLGFINWDHRREPLRETRKEPKPAACLFQCHVDLDQKMVLIGFTWHFLSLHPKKMMEIQVPCDTWNYSSNKFRKIPRYHWDIYAKIWHLQGVYIICFFSCIRIPRVIAISMLPCFNWSPLVQSSIQLASAAWEVSESKHWWDEKYITILYIYI